MSTEIEFKRMAFQTELETEYGKEINYIALGKFGSNNLTNLDGTIRKEWILIGLGRKGTVMDRVINLSKDAEGNMLRYQNGSTRPENYIKNWRETINNARAFENLKRLCKVIAYYRTESIHQEKIDYLENNGWKKDKINLYDETEAMKKIIEEPNDLKEIKEVYGYNGKMDGEPHYKVKG